MNTVTLPTVNLPKGPVTLRRLGLEDIATLSKLGQKPMQTWQARRASSLTDISLMSPEGMLSFLLIAFEECFDEVVDWLGSLLGLSPAQMRDPTQVPVELLPEIAGAAASHPELRGFVQTMARTWAKVQEAKQKLTEEAQSNGK